MKVFISGIAGFLGSHLADRFLEKNYEVIGCDNLIGGDLDNIPKRAKFYELDCCDFKEMQKVTKDVDIVYHCAATAYEGLSVFSPAIITKNNFQATSSIISASISNNVDRFIFCSSMARYGNNKVPFSEKMTPKPQDPYGIAKLASEDLLINLSETHGIDYVIAVPHNIIGPKQKYDDPFRNVVSIFINLILQGRQPFIYGDGNQKRCFSFIQDTIACLEKLAINDNVLGEVINIGPDEEFVTINHLAKVIAKLLDFDLKPIYVSGSPQEVKLANCSADKARKLLGYNTKYTLDEGIKIMIEWIKKKGIKPFKYHLPIEINGSKVPVTWTKRLM